MQRPQNEVETRDPRLNGWAAILMRSYVLVYFGAMLVALAVTPIVARVGRALKLLDFPGTRKVHKAAIPRLGGVAIVTALLAGVLPVLALDNAIGEAFRSSRTQIIGLLAGSVVVGMIGFLDDVWRLRARTKFICQIAAALAVCAAGVHLHSISAQDTGSIHLGWFAYPFAIVWIVGLTNAVNLIDGLDGLAAGICAVGSGVIALFALYTGQPIMVVLMLGLLGSLTGFLVYNFNPARIFMGDCGSLFVGFFLAGASLLCANAASTCVGLAILALALGVPIFDTLFSMVRRLLQRRSLFAPDRAHLHHKLLGLGLKHRQAVVFIHATTLLAAGLGMFMMITRGINTIALFGCLCLMLVLVFRMASSTPLADSLNAVRRIITVARHAKQQQRIFENAQLRFREAATFEAWWRAVCATTEELGFEKVVLAVRNRDGTSRYVIWQQVADLEPHQTINVTVPIPPRRAGYPPIEAEIDIPVDGSLEIAGLKLKLFSRLIDENSLAGLAKPGVNNSTDGQGTATDALQ